MRIITIGLVAVALASCGPTTEPTVIPGSCEPGDRVGTYLSHSEKVDGSCGELSDSVGRIDDPTFLPANCTHDAPDRWSNEGCKLERAFSCVATDGTGSRQSLVAVTEQQNTGGSLITGVMTMRLTDASGAFVCSGTYRITFTRQ